VKIDYPELSLFSRNNPQAVVSLVYQPQMKGAKMARFLAPTHATDTAVASSSEMGSALQRQTNLGVDFAPALLPPEWGAPQQLRIPIKLGFKSAKTFSAKK
jgi:hypothetical protein